MKVEFYRHNLGEAEKQEVQKCLDGIFLTTGAYVKQFEEKFAAYFGAARGVGLTSCTAALHLALLALDIGPGDEVITTPMTFIATSNAVLYVGARPVFVDVEPSTGLMDWKLIEAKITPKTKAIIAVHLYGQMCDMRAIRTLADKHGLKVIEDCAHSVESMRDGVKPAQLSDAACFSFYATKNVTCGEGGAVVTNDAALAERLLVLRQHGMSKSAADRYSGNYQHWDMVELGWKYNMNNIQAAMLLPQVPRIEERWQKRHELYQRYCQELSMDGVKLPVIVDKAKSAYHLFTILVSPDKRDNLLAHLNAAGVACAVNYRAVHLLQYYREKFGYQKGCLPVAEQWGNSTISLPFWVGLPDDQVKYVAEKIREFLKA